jgi:hypothetical protein
LISRHAWYWSFIGDRCLSVTLQLANVHLRLS